MDFPLNINKEESCVDQEIHVNSKNFSPIIPLVENDHYAERLQVSPLPSPSHAGAEGFDWVLCYSDDIYSHWQHIEQTRMMVKGYPNMAIIRPLLIDILRDLQTNYGLTNTTLHLAAYILDNFLSRNSENIPLKFAVITSLLVAAKVEDGDMRMPRFFEINQAMLNNAFSLMDFRNLEAKVLFCLDFRLTVPTVATFADFFSRISVVLDDFHMYKQIFYKSNSQRFQTLLSDPDERIHHSQFERYDEMLTAVNQLLHRLIDLTLDSVTLLNVLPSQMAAACIAAARQLYNVQPVWTPFLEMQSCYSELEIRHLMNAVISIYDMRASDDSASKSSSLTDSGSNNDIGKINDLPLIDINNTSIKDCHNLDH